MESITKNINAKSPSIMNQVLNMNLVKENTTISDSKSLIQKCRGSIYYGFLISLSGTVVAISKWVYDILSSPFPGWYR